MSKEPREKFESLDHIKRSEAFSEYRSYWDDFDLKVKDTNLKKFVCKMPLTKEARRGLLKSINSPIE